MHKAINQLKPQPEALIIDGNRFKPLKEIPHTCLIKGDGRFASIAAASILAKTYRDDYMQKIHREWTMYGWDKNKGYGTADHRKAIEQHGLSAYHRKSFNILPK
jgi:ribonuclease HII